MSERKHLLWIVTVGGSLILVVFLVSLCAPNFVRSGPSKTGWIVNNLRQLDGAKQQWGLDHGKTGAVMVTEEDVAPYLRSFKPAAGERYILKALSESPEAQLTREVGGNPKGSVLRLDTNGAAEVILPNNSLHSTPR